MARIPEPAPGLVIRYAYLWKREAARGQIEGSKDRPAAIVLAVEADDEGGKTIWVAPITHTPPRDPNAAVELPSKTALRLGLDGDPSWIVVSEVNDFAWPGPDIRPVAPGRWAYGLLPEDLFRTVSGRLARFFGQRKLARVPRDNSDAAC